jgi:hypothetical protein
MKKDWIPYELALALKQLGFDETCFGWFRNTEFTISFNDLYPKERGEEIKIIAAPTYSQAFRFFREKHGLYPDIYRIGKKFNAGIEDMNIGSSKEMVVEGVDYEEAELACLRKLIEIANDKQ